jgi:hypothetical protein
VLRFINLIFKNQRGSPPPFLLKQTKSKSTPSKKTPNIHGIVFIALRRLGVQMRVLSYEGNPCRGSLRSGSSQFIHGLSAQLTHYILILQRELFWETRAINKIAKDLSLHFPGYVRT